MSHLATPTIQLAELAELVQGKLHGDPQINVSGIAAILAAGSCDITFAEEEKYLVCTANQLHDFLNITEVKSSDYNSIKALVQGEVDTYLGFKFIRSERLGTDSSSNRQVLAFCKSAIGLAVGADVTTKISERADKNYATQVFLSMTIGATRIEDEKMVEIACTES